MRGEEIILLNFPISHFLKSLVHSDWLAEYVNVFMKITDILQIKLQQYFEWMAEGSVRKTGLFCWILPPARYFAQAYFSFQLLQTKLIYIP